jgi:hypothetical protein
LLDGARDLPARPNNQQLKRDAATIKMKYRMTCLLKRRLDQNMVRMEAHTELESEHISELLDGRP